MPKRKPTAAEKKAIRRVRRGATDPARNYTKPSGSCRKWSDSPERISCGIAARSDRIGIWPGFRGSKCTECTSRAVAAIPSWRALLPSAMTGDPDRPSRRVLLRLLPRLWHVSCPNAVILAHCGAHATVALLARYATITSLPLASHVCSCASTFFLRSRAVHPIVSYAPFAHTLASTRSLRRIA